MSPFQHNIRKLRQAYRKAETPELKESIHIAAISNDICHKNRRTPGALTVTVPWMENDMKAAGVEPVSMQAA